MLLVVHCVKALCKSLEEAKSDASTGFVASTKSEARVRNSSQAIGTGFEGEVLKRC